MGHVGVDSKHPEYEAGIKRWKVCRDVLEGEDAVKEAGAEYLPKLSKQSPTEYQSYLMRADFYAASSRTLEGITGTIFRRQPQFQPSAPTGEVEELLSEIGQENVPFDVFAKMVFRNFFGVGRHGVLLDTDDVGLDEQTKGTVRPRLKSYTAESIINWKLNDDGDLIMVVLAEKKDIFKEDGFGHDSIEKRRVLRLGIPQSDMEDNEVRMRMGEQPLLLEDVYHVEVYRKTTDAERKKTGNKDKWILEDVIIPLIRGNRIDYIPFVFFNPTEISSKVEKPPMLDLCRLNLSHYRLSADHEHGLHFTGLPTPWAAGFSVKEGTELSIGSTVAWVAEQPDAKAGFLEFTGRGLSAIRDALKSKEDRMAVLGARLLEEPRKSVESADTQKSRRSGEESILASAAGVLDRGFSKLLGWIMEWLAREKISAEFNKDYVDTILDPKMMSELMSAVQTGTMSMETYLWNLKRGELLPEDRTVEDEMDLIEQGIQRRVENNDDEDDEEEDDNESEEEEDESETQEA